MVTLNEGLKKEIRAMDDVALLDLLLLAAKSDKTNSRYIEVLRGEMVRRLDPQAMQNDAVASSKARWAELTDTPYPFQDLKPSTPVKSYGVDALQDAVLEECDDLFNRTTVGDYATGDYGLSAGDCMTDYGVPIQPVHLCIHVGDEEVTEHYPITFVLKAFLTELEADGKDIHSIISNQLNHELNRTDIY